MIQYTCDHCLHRINNGVVVIVGKEEYHLCEACALLLKDWILSASKT